MNRNINQSRFTYNTKTCICNGLLFSNWFMIGDKVKNRMQFDFFFKYLCSKRVFYLCRKISQGSFRQRHRDKGFWLLLLLEYKLVLPLLCNELLGRDVSGTLDGMWRVNVQKWQSRISHANVQSGRDNLLRTF